MILCLSSICFLNSEISSLTVIYWFYELTFQFLFCWIREKKHSCSVFWVVFSFRICSSLIFGMLCPFLSFCLLGYFFLVWMWTAISTQSIFCEKFPYKYFLFCLLFCNMRAWGRGEYSPDSMRSTKALAFIWESTSLLLSVAVSTTLTLPPSPPTQIEEEKKMSHSLQNSYK